jgi:hypothetical protein
MRKKKYGEDTVVIRVPASRKEEILKLLERYEVIDDLTQLKTDNLLHDAFMKGYVHCYDKWEEYNFILPYVLLGELDFIPKCLDMLRGKLPASMSQSFQDEMFNVLMKHSRTDKVMQQLELINSFFEDAWANPANTDFLPALFADSTTRLKQTEETK